MNEQKTKNATADVLRLVRIDFDNLENRDARREKVVGIFVPRDDLTAYGVAEEWFRKQPPEQFYTGWDHQIYPQWRLDRDRAL